MCVCVCVCVCIYINIYIYIYIYIYIQIHYIHMIYMTCIFSPDPAIRPCNKMKMYQLFEPYCFKKMSRNVRKTSWSLIIWRTGKLGPF